MYSKHVQHIKPEYKIQDEDASTGTECCRSLLTLLTVVFTGGRWCTGAPQLTRSTREQQIIKVFIFGALCHQEQ